jgi:hypothetical protein
MGHSCWQSCAFLTRFANSFGPGCWQSWASPEARTGFANSFFPCCWQRKLLAKLSFFANSLSSPDAVGKPSCWQSCRSLCHPVFANNSRFPVGEGNGIRADGVPPSPTVYMAVGEAFPTGSAFLLAKSSFPSLKTPTALSQQELRNPVGKAFANRVGVFANNLVCQQQAKHAFPVVTVGEAYRDGTVQTVVRGAEELEFTSGALRRTVPLGSHR